MFNAKARFALGSLFVALLATTAIPPSALAASQTTYASPDQAVDRLAEAVRTGSPSAIGKVLGPGSARLIESGDKVADKTGREKFIADYDQAHKIDVQHARAELILGTAQWPFPIPLVEKNGAWRFDTRAGATEILDRRIGHDELTAIQTSRAIVDAQRDYASEDRNGDGLLEYADRFVSSPGKHDGLYWPTTAGGKQSPLGPLVAQARAEGYPALRAPYHGYYFRMINAQGPHAKGGPRDYRAHGHMIGGFAVVAYPAKWGDSGVMTFIVNQRGNVYEKNLGRDTQHLAQAMKRYDPDPSWKRAP